MQTDLEFIKNLLINIGFIDVTNFDDLRYKDKTFYSLEGIDIISLKITYKQDEFNNDLILIFNMKGKRIKEL